VEINDGGKDFCWHQKARPAAMITSASGSARKSADYRAQLRPGRGISVKTAARREQLVQSATAQFYHVTTTIVSLLVYGSQQESGSAATQSRSDYGEITFRDWHLIGIFEYGYIAVDPLDPTFCTATGSRDQNKISASTRKLRRSPFAAASIVMRARCRLFFRRSNHTRFIRGERAVQNDGCGKQLAGHQSGSHARILRDPRQPRCFSPRAIRKKGSIAA